MGRFDYRILSDFAKRAEICTQFTRARRRVAFGRHTATHASHMASGALTGDDKPLITSLGVLTPLRTWRRDVLIFLACMDVVISGVAIGAAEKVTMSLPSAPVLLRYPDNQKPRLVYVATSLC